MIAEARLSEKAFKRALIASAVGHTILFAFILINPALPKKPSPKGVIHYMSMSRIGGGGGGSRPAGGGSGGGVKTEIEKPAAKKESLRDLTTPDKVKPKAESKLRYPVDDKTKRKSTPEKKATVSKTGPGSKEETTGGAAGTAGRIGSGGSGLSIAAGGTGTGEGGLGFGEGGFGDGLAQFPYAYYLQRIQDKIEVNWFPGRIDPGPGVTLQTVVYFRIYRNGSISTIDIKQSSGLPNFDMFAVRAVYNAAPFPPLPDDYEEEYFGINLLFEHTR